MVDSHRVYRDLAGGVRDTGFEGIHRQSARGERRTHLPAGRDRRVVGARKPTRLQSIDRQHSGLFNRNENAGAGDGGRADRGRSDPAPVQAHMKMRRETIHAYLLLLPAVVLLIAFTHWPAIETLVDSF